VVQIKARGVLVRIIRVKPLIYRRQLRAKILQPLEISQDTPADFHFYYRIRGVSTFLKESTLLICKQITQGYDRELTWTAAERQVQSRVSAERFFNGKKINGECLFYY